MVRKTLLFATVLLCAASGAAIAQIIPDTGQIGPRIDHANGSTGSAIAPYTAMSPGQVQRQQAEKIPPAIPEKQARATIQETCDGTVSSLGLDRHAVWHAQCDHAGKNLQVTLGPNGIPAVR